MFKTLKLAVSALFMVGTVTAQNAGLTASLDIAIVEQAKETYFDYILQELRNLEIPDISFDGGHLNQNSFTVGEDSSNVDISLDTGNNAIVMEVNDLSASFKSNDFRYKWSFIVVKGSVSVSMADVDVKVGVSMTTQEVDGVMLPGFGVSQASVNIPKDKLKIKISGNFASKIANAFEGLFKKKIVNEIEDQLVKTINDELPKSLNKLVADQKGVSKINGDLWADWTIFTEPMITPQFIEAGVKGLMFDDRIGEVEPDVRAPVMPYHDSDEAAQLQLQVSSYFADSLFSSLLSVYGLSFQITADQIPDNFPIQLTTSSLKWLLPDLYTTYGDAPLMIDMAVTRAGDFKSHDNSDTVSLTLDGNMVMYVLPENSTAVEALAFNVNNVYANGTVVIYGLNLTGNITSLDVSSLNITYQQETDISLDQLTLLVNMCLNLGVPFFDLWVADQFFAIPDELFGIFQLSDLVLNYKDSYIEAGLTPTFLPIPTQDYTPWSTFSEDLGWMVYEIDFGFITVELDLNVLADYFPSSMWYLQMLMAMY